MSDAGLTALRGQQQTTQQQTQQATTGARTAPGKPPPGGKGRPRRAILIAVAFLAVAAGAFAWWYFSRPALPPGFFGGNGRLEANQVYISTKYPGRIKDVLFNEGDTVEAGQVVARMDTSALEAQLREAEAQIRQARDARRVAEAQVAVKQADYNYANTQYQRSKGLVPRGAVSQQEADVDNAKMLASRAELVGAGAEVTKSQSAIDAARATADRLRSEINDAVLVAPLRARVDTRLAEPGEVLGQGGRVFSLVDLADVYMYVFLPENVTGKVALGSDARIVLDSAPQYPVRAFVSYVSPVAQFTPKTVETAEERRNLTFRVKLQIDKNRLRQFEPLVKVGVPGMGYVRTDPKAAWPEKLQFRAVNPSVVLGNPTGSVGTPK